MIKSDLFWFIPVSLKYFIAVLHSAARIFCNFYLSLFLEY